STSPPIKPARDLESERPGGCRASPSYPRRSLQGVVVEFVEDAGVLVQRGGLGGRQRVVDWVAVIGGAVEVNRDEDRLTLGRRVGSLRIVSGAGQKVQLVSHVLAREVDRRVGRLLLGRVEV